MILGVCGTAEAVPRCKTFANLGGYEFFRSLKEPAVGRLPFSSCQYRDLREIACNLLRRDKRLNRGEMRWGMNARLLTRRGGHPIGLARPAGTGRAGLATYAGAPLSRLCDNRATGRSIHRTFPAQGEVTMQSPTEPAPTRSAKRTLPAVLLSVALHASVLAFVLLLGKAARTKLIEPTHSQTMALLKTAGGSHAVRIPLPAMEFAAHSRNPTPDPEATKKTILPVERTHPKMSGGGAPKTPHAGDGSAQALRGNGSDADDATPAFPIFSPHPPVTDRSLLPPSEAKIVVDVNVDALGQVISETLVKGMGNKLDQIVLDTAKTWRFQPAKVNGKPVASQAELIFPFTPAYPITVS